MDIEDKIPFSQKSKRPILPHRKKGGVTKTDPDAGTREPIIRTARTRPLAADAFQAFPWHPLPDGRALKCVVVPDRSALHFQDALSSRAALNCALHPHIRVQ